MTNRSMTVYEKMLVSFTAVLALSLGTAPSAHAMHIMEGYLPGGSCIAWGVICLPFLLAGFFSIRRTLASNRKALVLLAMSGAFIFVISSLKIPSVTGSCSHMTGTGLGAILFGPSAVSILGLIVLLFQAILLAHGGLTTLGANTFSMAVAGPILSWLIYTICKKLNINRRVSIFLAAALGDLWLGLLLPGGRRHHRAAPNLHPLPGTGQPHKIKGCPRAKGPGASFFPVNPGRSGPPLPPPPG